MEDVSKRIIREAAAVLGADVELLEKIYRLGVIDGRLEATNNAVEILNGAEQRGAA